VTVRVCDSLACAMQGSEALLAELQASTGPGFRVVRAPCLGLCDAAPAVEVGHNFVRRADAPAVLAAVASGDTPRAPAGLRRLRRLPGDRRLPDAGADPLRGDERRRGPVRPRRRGPQGPRWRGLPHGAQVALRAGRAGAAPHGGERGRGRARYLQGPALPRHGPAPLPGGHAHRRPRGRGDGRLHLHPATSTRPPEILAREMAKLPPGGPVPASQRGGGGLYLRRGIGR
jgi:formate dehydrogenase